MGSELQPLVRFARRKTGQGLRAVIRDTTETTEAHFVREDLSESTVIDRLETIGDTVACRSDEEAGATFGPVRASIQLRDSGHVVVLHRSEDLVLLTFEPYAGRNLGSFLRQSRRVLQELPEREVETAHPVE